MTNNSHIPPICDYEGSSYRTDFWEGKGRDYEDKAERIALETLLPFGGGQHVLEIGAGYGRLTTALHAYEQVVLMDYSLTQMQQAQENHGKQQRFVYVVADVYALPFRPGVFDAATMIRVIHHLKDVPRAFAQVRDVLAPGGLFILEHANKRNLKAMLRYALGQQGWNPYTRLPHEFVELNLDFHPDYILDELRDANFEVMRRVPVSYLRLKALKEGLPIDTLMLLETLLQKVPAFYAPSIFTKSIALGDTPDNTNLPLSDPETLFAAPDTGNPLRHEGDTMVDTVTGTRWAIRDGIYDFKTPVS